MTTHLTKRNGRYYIRRRIPTDLLPHYAGKKEKQLALGTSDPREAQKLVRRAGANIDDEFEAVRASLQADQQATPPTPTGRVYTRAEIDEEERTQVELAAEFPANSLRDEAEEVQREHKAAREAANHARLVAAVREAIAHSPATPLESLTTPEALPAALQPIERAIRRPQDNARSLEALVRKWALERKPTARSEQAMRRHIDRLRDAIGDIPVSAIVKAHIVTFKDRLLETGNSVANTNYSLTNVGVLLNFGEQQDWLKSNPAKGVRIQDEKPNEKARIPFSESALNAIFSSPAYSEGFRTLGGAGETIYWLPLLGLFTGARIEELVQLTYNDIREESYRDSQGALRTCWVMLITNEGEVGGRKQTLKNPGSRRRIPIHAELLARGFIEYVESRKEHGRLFPVKVQPNGPQSANWSQWWHKNYLRPKCEVTDPRMVFHSFRHSFKEVCRECGIEKDVRDALQGHSEGDSAGKYGGDFYPLRPLVDAMERYTVHGVKLPRALLNPL
jgi:integrase